MDDNHYAEVAREYRRTLQSYWRSVPVQGGSSDMFLPRVDEKPGADYPVDKDGEG